MKLFIPMHFQGFWFFILIVLFSLFFCKKNFQKAVSLLKNILILYKCLVIY